MASALAVLLLWASLQGEVSSSRFAYVGPEKILTVEVAGARRLIVNIINLSGYVFVFEPQELLVRSEGGKRSIGQVIEGEKGRAPYLGSAMVQPRSFQGLTVWGAFEGLDRIQEISLRLGAALHMLKPVNERDFEVLSHQITELDLQSDEMDAQMKNRGLQPLGERILPQSEEGFAELYAGLLAADGINPPRVLEKTVPRYPQEALEKKIEGVVELQGLITREGDFVQIKVKKGLGHGLDQRAVETVRNSWKFLPATRNGEVREAQTTIAVEFKLPS
ncbi:MAG: energy transducer TonB [Acidobacteria bacterium]|nr:energy transducer TonB [Acidobacteriota bacterium]